MNELLKTEIELYCFLVKRGKPCASVPIQKRYDEEALFLSAENGCKAYSEFLYAGWRTLWIYKKPFMFEIIKALPNRPETAYDHWVLGKAFGYSDESIEQFLTASERSVVTSGAGRQSV